MADAALQSQADAAADQYGVPRNLLSALISRESAWNPWAVGGQGEIGLTQLMPATAQALGISNAWDTSQNLAGGASLLSRLYDQYKDWRKALSAYNSGTPDSAAGLNYADAVLSAAGPLSASNASGGTVTPLGSNQSGSWLEGLLRGVGVGQDIYGTTDPGAVAGGVTGSIMGGGDGSIAAPGLHWGNLAKYGILGFIVLVALVLGLLALSRSTRETVLPAARGAVS